MTVAERIKPEDVQMFDSVEHLRALQEVCRAVATKQATRQHGAGDLGDTWMFVSSVHHQ